MLCAGSSCGSEGEGAGGAAGLEESLHSSSNTSPSHTLAGHGDTSHSEHSNATWSVQTQQYSSILRH